MVKFLVLKLDISDTYLTSTKNYILYHTTKQLKSFNVTYNLFDHLYIINIPNWVIKLNIIFDKLNAINDHQIYSHEFLAIYLK